MQPELPTIIEGESLHDEVFFDHHIESKSDHQIHDEKLVITFNLI